MGNKKNKVNPASDGGSHRKMITDTRFASLHSDPRFREPPKHKAKVAIDSRFNRMFTDKNFSTTKARTDKRGKPKNSDTAAKSLKHYYRLEEEGEGEGGGGVKDRKFGKKLLENEHSEDVESDEESESESENGESESEKVKKGSLKLESQSESSDSEVDDEEEETDDSATSTSDSDEAYEEEEDVQEEHIPEIDKETHRLAVVNMDWSQVKAVDLYVMLSSFLPTSGQILSVAVYPSEFGLKRMEEEAIHGPVGLFDDDKRNNDEDEDEDEDDDNEIDNEKLRAYELSRLRYYYAVVECDSIATADYLYRTCDGVEFERSSTTLDLRFIPDSMEFKHQPRDVAKHAPADYEGLDFQTRALQQTKIHLTWDDDEPQRTKTLKRKFNDDQLAELELQEFLASDESDSSDSENEDVMQHGSAKKPKKQDMYRALIQSGDGSDENDEEDQDMEVTFNTGLEDLSKQILEKKDRKSETVWEAYLRKRREKKKARKNRSNDSSEDESDTDNEPAEEPDDFFLEESSAKGSKIAQGRKGRKEKQNEGASQEAEASRAELELLLADDKGTDPNLKGYNLKRKKMKGKKGKEIPDERNLPTVDYDDPRFSAMFTSPLFALDPTDPQFKRSAAYARQMANRQQKSELENKRVKEPSESLRQGLMSNKAENDDNGELRPHVPTSKKEKQELSSLVRSIKMKSKQMAPQDKTLEKNNNLKVKAKKSKKVNRAPQIDV